MIEFQSRSPSENQFYALFEMTGWNSEYQAKAQELAQAVANSQYVVAACDGGRLVGVGRVVSDNVLHAMIYDLIVDPKYKRQGIGSQILQRLVEWCFAGKIRDIQLFCARGQIAFYQKNGFAARPTDAPGMQYNARNQ